MKRFFFNRIEDVSGVSGTGRVAEGIQFTNGRVAVQWCAVDRPNSFVLYECIEDAQEIHGHDGRTKIVWVD